MEPVTINITININSDGVTVDSDPARSEAAGGVGFFVPLEEDE